MDKIRMHAQGDGMKTTWGIYGEIMRGKLDLYKSGIFNRPLHLDGLLPMLARELENTDLLATDAAWSIHLVAWAGEREAPERLLTGPRGELHVEISLWDRKGVQVRVDEGLIRLHTPAKAEMPEFTLGIDPAPNPAVDPEGWTGQILLVRMSPVEFAEFQNRTRQMTQILELVPADYELDDACTGEGGVVAQIYELLHGAELANPDDEHSQSVVRTAEDLEAERRGTRYSALKEAIDVLTELRGELPATGNPDDGAPVL